MSTPHLPFPQTLVYPQVVFPLNGAVDRAVSAQHLEAAMHDIVSCINANAQILHEVRAFCEFAIHHHPELSAQYQAHRVAERLTNEPHQNL